MVATWVLTVLIVAAGAALLIAAALAVGTSTRLVVWKSFRCPLKQRHVTVGFLADRCRRDQYSDVLSCSAFAAPWQVSCDKRCLHLREYEGQVKSVKIERCGLQPGSCEGSIALAQRGANAVTLAVKPGTWIQRGGKYVTIDELGVGNYIKARAMQIAGEPTPRLTEVEIGGD